MSSVQSLREFISERLTAAAAEIFSEFEKTVVRYEEEIDRQRRLLDVTWRPEIKTNVTGLPAQHVYQTEEIQIDQHQERHNGLQLDECEPPHVTEHQEGPLTCQEDGQLIVKQETDAFMVTAPYEDSDYESSSRRLFSHGFPVTENQEQESGLSGSTRLFLRKSDHASDIDSASNSSCIKRRDKKNVGGKAFKTKYHHRMFSNQKSCVCNTCGKAFKYPSALESHMRSHTGEKPYSCKMCGKGFSVRFNLKVHMRSHTGERPDFCKICGATFTNKGHLRYHMKTHATQDPGSDDRPFACDTCGKRYTSRASLVVHVRSHTGEKPFVCKMCGRRFSRNANCKIHMRIHTGERPYSCKMCERTFTNKASLRYHTRVHTG